MGDEAVDQTQWQSLGDLLKSHRCTTQALQQYGLAGPKVGALTLEETKRAENTAVWVDYTTLSFIDREAVEKMIPEPKIETHKWLWAVRARAITAAGGGFMPNCYFDFYIPVHLLDAVFATELVQVTAGRDKKTWYQDAEAAVDTRLEGQELKWAWKAIAKLLNMQTPRSLSEEDRIKRVDDFFAEHGELLQRAPKKHFEWVPKGFLKPGGLVWNPYQLNKMAQTIEQVRTDKRKISDESYASILCREKILAAILPAMNPVKKKKALAEGGKKAKKGEKDGKKVKGGKKVGMGAEDPKIGAQKNKRESLLGNKSAADRKGMPQLVGGALGILEGAALAESQNVNPLDLDKPAVPAKTRGEKPAEGVRLPEGSEGEAGLKPGKRTRDSDPRWNDLERKLLVDLAHSDSDPESEDEFSGVYAGTSETGGSEGEGWKKGDGVKRRKVGETKAPPGCTPRRGRPPKKDGRRVGFRGVELISPPRDWTKTILKNTYANEDDDTIIGIMEPPAANSIWKILETKKRNYKSVIEIRERVANTFTEWFCDGRDKLVRELKSKPSAMVSLVKILVDAVAKSRKWASFVPEDRAADLASYKVIKYFAQRAPGGMVRIGEAIDHIVESTGAHLRCFDYANLNYDITREITAGIGDIFVADSADDAAWSAEEIMKFDYGGNIYSVGGEGGSDMSRDDRPSHGRREEKSDKELNYLSQSKLDAARENPFWMDVRDFAHVRSKYDQEHFPYVDPAIQGDNNSSHIVRIILAANGVREAVHFESPDALSSSSKPLYKAPDLRYPKDVEVSTKQEVGRFMAGIVEILNKNYYRKGGPPSDPEHLKGTSAKAWNSLKNKIMRTCMEAHEVEVEGLFINIPRDEDIPMDWLRSRANSTGWRLVQILLWSGNVAPGQATKIWTQYGAGWNKVPWDALQPSLGLRKLIYYSVRGWDEYPGHTRSAFDYINYLILELGNKARDRKLENHEGRLSTRGPGREQPLKVGGGGAGSGSGAERETQVADANAGRLNTTKPGTKPMKPADCPWVSTKVFMWGLRNKPKTTEEDKKGKHKCKICAHPHPTEKCSYDYIAKQFGESAKIKMPSLATSEGRELFRQHSAIKDNVATTSPEWKEWVSTLTGPDGQPLPPYQRGV